eukprot:11194728-Lingulodinium_polyedra.AAC.1
MPTTRAQGAQQRRQKQQQCVPVSVGPRRRVAPPGRQCWRAARFCCGRCGCCRSPSAALGAPRPPRSPV